MDRGDIELLTPKQAADALQVPLATLRGFVKDGDLVFINKSRGKERPRMAFDPADIEEFKRRRKKRLAPCPTASTSKKTPNSNRPKSGSTVVGFLERLEERRSERLRHKQTELKKS
jgi:hypothetical protein